MKLNPNVIAPSQNFLKPDTITYIFNCLKNDKQADLPVTPIIRQDAVGKYVAIDGHNLLAVKSYLNEETEVHVAHSATDGLSDDSEENKVRNKVLFERYETCLDDQIRVREAGIASFQDLIEHNKDLFNKRWGEL